MTVYGDVFREALEVLHKEGRYREFAELRRIRGQYPKARYFRDN